MTVRERMISLRILDKYQKNPKLYESRGITAKLNVNDLEVETREVKDDNDDFCNNNAGSLT